MSATDFLDGAITKKHLANAVPADWQMADADDKKKKKKKRICGEVTEYHCIENTERNCIEKYDSKKGCTADAKDVTEPMINLK